METVVLFQGRAFWIVLAFLNLASPAQHPASIGPGALAFREQRSDMPTQGTVSIVDENHVWVGLTHTRDGGASWFSLGVADEAAKKYLTFPAYPAAEATYFRTENLGWLQGKNAIWRTTDGGRTWLTLFPGYSTMTIAFADEVVGMMAINKIGATALYKTTNGGENWSACGKTFQPSTATPMNVSFISEKEAWAVYADSDTEGFKTRGVSKTMDGGCTWEPLWLYPGEGKGCLINGIHFANKDLGWSWCLGYGVFLQTNDGGVHWRTIPQLMYSYYVADAYVADATHGWIAGNNLKDSDSGLFFTADGGQHWGAITKTDIVRKQGLAREIPDTWGYGALWKMAALHEKKRR